MKKVHYVRTKQHRSKAAIQQLTAPVETSLYS